MAVEPACRYANEHKRQHCGPWKPCAVALTGPQLGLNLCQQLSDRAWSFVHLQL